MNDLRVIAVTFVCCIAFATSVDAQEIKCPQVSVYCLSGDCYRSPFQFEARIIGDTKEGTISYNWSITSGRIVRGQGTSSIEVVRDSAASGNLTATVKVEGLPAKCGLVAASWTLIEGPAPAIQEVDEFGAVSFENVKPRLAILAYQLRNQPGARGFIVASNKWRLAGAAQNYLKTKFAFASGRIVYLENKEPGRLQIKLYVVPAGATPPG